MKSAADVLLRRFFRRSGLLLLAAAIGLSMSACGSGGESGTSPDRSTPTDTVTGAAADLREKARDAYIFTYGLVMNYRTMYKQEDLKRGDDGSLTVYVGSKSPGPQNESNWLPAPDGPFSLYIRAYWGEQGILDGSWQPPPVQAG